MQLDLKLVQYISNVLEIDLVYVATKVKVKPSCIKKRKETKATQNCSKAQGQGLWYHNIQY